jgi:creatinine amidohydrolase
MAWEEVKALDHRRSVALLPIGATEAHGPHLPLSTDVIISEAMVESAASWLEKGGLIPVVLPSLAYTAASFGSDFPGTISLGEDTATGLLVDIARAVAKMEIPVLALANSHLDPTHLRSLSRAIAICGKEKIIEIAFPDITRKPWALRLTDEFKTGACHAGQFEGSIVMAAEGRLVREQIQAALPDNPASLSEAIRSGKTSFEEAGGSRAYFGYPSRASAEEGEQTIDTLGKILEESVLEVFARLHAPGPEA